MPKRFESGVWWMAAGKVALLLATTRLGYHRDELYFVAASKSLAPSYVDFQPVVPVLLRLERALFGDSLHGLRLIPALAGAAAVVLAALIARELGGGRRAQLLAAFSMVIVPLLLGMASTLNTVVLETPAWMLVAFVVARLLRTEDPRLWVALGAVIALALLVKFTVLAYLFGLSVAVLVSPLRRHLRTPWPWLGGLVIAAAMAPSIVWQARHSWAVVEFVSHQGTGGRILGLSGRPGFLISLALLPGPVALWLWVPGLRRLWRDHAFRVLGVTHAIALVVLFAASGKGYYAAPAIAVLLAAGAVALDTRPGWSARGLVIALCVSVIVAVPLFAAPITWLRASKDLAQATELGERIGWEEMARTVALHAHRVDADVVIGSNYSIAADVEFYAKRFRLPPAGSGHNSAYLWKPPVPDDHVAIVVGFDELVGRGEPFLRTLYRDVDRVGTIRNREGVHNYEWGDPIYVARGPKLSWDDEWERLKFFTA